MRARIQTAIAAVLGAAFAPAIAAPPALFGQDGFGQDDPDAERVTARLIAEHDTLVAGEVNHVGVLFEIDDDWHIYWDGLNDSGYATSITVAAPDGYEVGETIYPAPHRHIAPGDILDHTYEGTVLLMVPVEVPESAPAGQAVTIRADAEWLACREACIPGWAEGLELTLPVASPGTTPARSADASEFERARAQVPVPIEEAPLRPTVQWVRGSLVVAAYQSAHIEFYPGPESSRLQDPIGGASAEGERLILRPDPESSGVLEGVLAVQWRGEDAPRYYRFRSEPHDPIAMPSD